MYLALFSILFTGVLLSSYTFLTGTQHITAKVVQENESAFVARKISALLLSANAIILPNSGTHTGVLTFSTYSGGVYTVTATRGMLTLTTNGARAVPLTAERVVFSNFSATHTAPVGTLPRFLEYSFTVNGEVFGPIGTYVTF